MLKYSRQRESIKDFLRNCHEHPTADTIYMAIRKEYPNISLGTVYRNLSLLVSLGEITKIPCADGADRFDADTHPHYHFMCNRCGCVEDLSLKPIDGLNELAKNFYDGRIHGHQTHFYGLCPKCVAEQEKQNKKDKENS